MHIQILTPEHVIFDGEIDSVLLPGKNGAFHVMKNHAPVVSALEHGKVMLYGDSVGTEYLKYFTEEKDQQKNVFSFPIKSGVLEFKDNKGIILAE